MSSKPVYLCETHKKKYVGYCESCNINICLLCTSKHENHELLQYNEIQPSDKKVEELRQKFIEFKKQKIILKQKLDLWLEKINHYTTKIKEILDNNEKVYENILSNYDTNNLIYSEIDNMNELRKRGIILGYKNINLDIFSTDDKILEKSELIMKTIKEMQIEDIFYSIKEQKNMIGNININDIKKKISQNEKEKKENDENKENKDNKDNKENKPKTKKVVKKKKSSISKKDNNKENKKNKDEQEKELVMKKYEDFKEINLKSKLFDTEYLINLDKKTSSENAKNNLNNENSSLFREINNIREINHLCLVSYNSIKYIVTTGYCYLNLFDLRGELQRSIKIHENDITYLIQIKNGDLLTCSIDGTMKIIRLGKNEGYSVIQTIDTSKVKNENKNSIFSNNQLYVLLQIKSNENIITAHGSNLLFYKQTKDNKDLYEFKEIVSYNKKIENDYDIIFNNNNISSLIEINNDNFVALNNNTILFFEKENKDSDKYIFKSEIKNICGSGGPNNIVYFDNKIMIAGGSTVYIVDIIEKKILNEIKIKCCGINCININKNNNLLLIGYETNEHEFNITENHIINEENKINIKEDRIIKKAHTNSISNLIHLEEDENKDDNTNTSIKLTLVSGAHDKYLKYWA